jgi:CDP-glucose 4,6-dehydratase
MSVVEKLESLRGKKVFVTGHTGFKGSWLLMLLDRLGARVTGYSRSAPTTPSLFEAARLVDLVETHHEADIRDAARLAAAVRAVCAELGLSEARKLQ